MRLPTRQSIRPEGVLQADGYPLLLERAGHWRRKLRDHGREICSWLDAAYVPLKKRTSLRSTKLADKVKKEAQMGLFFIEFSIDAFLSYISLPSHTICREEVNKWLKRSKNKEPVGKKRLIGWQCSARF